MLTRNSALFVLVVLLLPNAYAFLSVHLYSQPLVSPREEQNIETTLPVASVEVRALAPSKPVAASPASKLLALSAGARAANSFPGLATTSASSLSIVTSFDGLNQIQSCTCAPPDVQVAAGPNHLVEMVNLEGQIFTKQGVSNKTFTLASFFTSGSDSISDPKILFDVSSNRWFASLADISVGSVIVAVSSSIDPTGSWTIYRLSAGSFLPDQPIIGVSDDKFVASANDFRSTSFVGAKYWVLNKAQLLAGSSVSTFSSTINNGFFSIHPIQSLSATTTQYMVSNIVSGGAFSMSTMELFSITGVPGVSTVTTQTSSVSVSSLTIPPAAAQQGTMSTIDTGDIRVEDAVWYKGTLWYGLNDGCTPAGDNQLRSCIRLIEVDTTASPIRLRQDFDYGTIGQYYFYPALRLDGLGDLDLIYGFSSSSSFPGLAVTGQAVNDSSGSIGVARSLRTGSIADTSTRYGDYYGAGLDPSNPSVVWVAGEYDSATTGSCGSFGPCWSTLIGSITMNFNTPGAGGRWAL